MTTETVPENSFTERHVRAFGKRVHRLGLATAYGLDVKGIEAGFERGLNYVFWHAVTSRKFTPIFRRLAPAQRERLVIATGPAVGFTAGSLRSRVEKALRTLRTEYLDVLQLMWLGTTASWSAAVVEAMVKLREEGKVRALGVSIHDRARAAKLALESPLDMLMLRYNAAHPGAERDIFPHLAKRQPAVVAYTATSWRQLLKRPRGWDGPVPTAGDCYRFCLTSPHVDVVLCAPKNLAQLEENLAALEKGPMSEAELAEMRRFGAAVHG